MARTRSGLTGSPRRGVGPAVAQLVGAEEVGVAPGRRLGVVAELLERVGAEARAPPRSRDPRRPRGSSTSATQRYSPLAKSSRARASTAAAPPMYSTYLRAALAGGSGSRLRGVGVVPAEIALVDRLGVVAERAVVAAHVPGSAEAPAATRGARRSRPALQPWFIDAGSGRGCTCRGRAARSRIVEHARRCPTPASGAGRRTSAPRAEQVDAPRRCTWPRRVGVARLARRGADRSCAAVGRRSRPG